MMRVRAISVALLLPLAGAAGAQGTFGLPQGCEAYATMQKRGCTVTHLFTCQGDPEGYQRRVDIGEEGPLYFGVIDAETQWIESHHLLAGRVERLLSSPIDAASFSELISTGVDTFDFVTEDDQGYRTRFVGSDTLPGTTVEIDGVTLERTEFQVIAYDPQSGGELWRTSGAEFIHREWRTFVSGISRVETADESWERDYTPVSFAFPGEEGFLSTQPLHDCSALMSKGPSQ